MKVILLCFLFLFSAASYSDENYKLISFKEAIINIPANWNVNNKNDCLLISKERMSTSDYLKICRNISSGESDYFAMNDDGEWEAVTDGIPVLADMSITSKFTGMSAIISCKNKDDAGYHTEQCFQAEINSPEKINFIFTGRGNPLFFKNYKKIYLSLRIK